MHTEGVNCDDRESTFVNGTSIFNSMKTITPFKGLTGFIQLDQQGNRENFMLDILELASEGLKKVGTWNATKGITSLRGKVIDNGNTDPNDLRNKTLTVLTVIVSSFVDFNSYLRIKILLLESSLRHAKGNFDSTERQRPVRGFWH